jgi:hypothetical protein
MNGVERIAAERQRQVDAEGWTPERDDKHDQGEMAMAAAAYAVASTWSDPLISRRTLAATWPWSDEWWKPTSDPIRTLEKAGALIAAEIDRLLRAASENPS